MHLKTRSLPVVFGAFLLCLSLNAQAETEQLLWTKKFDSPNGIKASSSEIKFSVADNELRLEVTPDCKIKRRWPQIIFDTGELTVDQTTAVEFSYRYIDVKGKIGLFLGAIPVNICRISRFPDNLQPDIWHKIRLPLSPHESDSAQIDKIIFTIDKNQCKDGDSAVFRIKDLKLIRTGKVVSPQRTVLKPYDAVGPDARMDIEINNLLNNPYLKVGDNAIPPRGWSPMGKEMQFKYARGNQGRAFTITADSYLSQSGLVLVPGEVYKISGYVRGEDFQGNGGIGCIGDGWKKFWGLKLKTSNTKNEWQYFETTFIFNPERNHAARFVMYMTKGSTGAVEIERPILEPLTSKGLKESLNILQGDDFDERYAKAMREGKLRGGPPSTDYKLVWSDEFDGDKLDESKWVNYELDIYRESRRTVVSTSRCARLDGKGHLELQSEFHDGLYYHPFPHTRGKFEPVFGYFECRFKLHSDDMVNACFYLMPVAKDPKPGPVKSGHEIDIFECILPSTNRVSQTTHYQEWDEAQKKLIHKSGGTVSRHAPGLNQGFHVIGLEWTPTEYIFYIDGVESYRLTNRHHPISHARQYIVLGLEVHRSLKNKYFDQEFKTSKYTIDYVRVYQK